MIKIENFEAFNIEGALRGMRNPMNSWDKSDSDFDVTDDYLYYEALSEFISKNYTVHSDDEFQEKELLYANNGVVDRTDGNILTYAFIGPNDLALAQKLILAGSDHRKFMRQIFVSMDITAPLYWWKEMDTYHVATATNSCSTMHKLATTPITKECFSFDTDLENFDGDMQQYIDEEGSYLTYSETVIRNCESLRRKYLTTKDLRYWRALIQLLPESWNQRRTWTANYENLRNLCNARVNHKLIEWREFVEFLRFHAPYAQDLIFYKGE